MLPPPLRLLAQIGEGAAHTESAWAERLPRALPFLLQPWWESWHARHSNSLYFTSPRKLQAGQPAVLFVNQAKSHALAAAPGPLRAKLGFNNWRLGGQEVALEPAPQLQPGGEPLGPGEPAKWQAASFVVPEAAYEMQFALTDAASSTWDNNAGGVGWVVCQAAPASWSASALMDDGWELESSHLQ